MIRVAIIAALPGELKPLVRGWRHESHFGVEVWRHSPRTETEWIAACAGIGPQPALRALAEIEAQQSVQRIFSVGWAGALQEEFRSGHAYRVGVVIDSATGERLRTTSDQATTWLVTSTQILGKKEKLLAASRDGAGLVDMEASALAQLAAQRGIPFSCIKGVSDGLTDHMPNFTRFVSPSGKFHFGRFVAFAAFRPWHWAGLVRLRRRSQAAAREMCSFILDDLEKPVG